MLLAMQPFSRTLAPAPSSTPIGGVDSNKRPVADGSCFILLWHGYYRVKRCRYHHDPADLAAPMAGSTGDNRHDSVSSGITKLAAGGTDGNRNGLGCERNGSDGSRNDSTSRVGNVGTDRFSRVVVGWCDDRGGAGGRGGTSGGDGSSGGGGTC